MKKLKEPMFLIAMLISAGLLQVHKVSAAEKHDGTVILELGTDNKQIKENPVNDNEPVSSAITIDNARIQETPPGAKTAVGYATLTSHVGDKLIGFSSPRAERVELHKMEMDSGIMRMRPAPEGVDLPAGMPVSLTPQGMHIMFTNISSPFKDNEKIPVTFVFENAKPQTIEIEVHALTETSDHHTP